jgi:flagellar biosynthesis regulator FlaF
MMKEADEISKGKQEGFDTIIAINTLIRDGLR